MSPVCLGVSLALTGPEAVYAQQLRQAIELAVDDERETLPLDIVVADDCAARDAAELAATRLVESDALAVIGPMNSWTCQVQGPIFARAGLAQITPSASNPELTRHGWPGFLRMCPDDLAQAHVLARVAHGLGGIHRVVAVHDGTSFAEPLAAAFLAAARRLGLDCGPVLAVAMDEAESFLHAADVVAGSRSDAVFIAGLEEPCRLAASTIRAAGSRAVFLGTDAIKPTRCLVTFGDVDGPYLTNAGVDAAQNARPFHERFEARFGPHHSIYTVEAYDAVRLLASAIRRTGVATRAGVREAVRRSPPYRGLTGEIAFDAHGERLAPRLAVYRWDGAQVQCVGSQTPGSDVSGVLETRAAVITGAAQGIGRAMAIRFAAEGIRVWAVDLPKQRARLEAVVDAIESTGGTAAFCEVDITSPGDRNHLVDTVSASDAFPSVLVNNAGTQFVASCLATEPEDLERLLGVHVVAAYQLTRLLALQWIDRRTAAAVVNVASIAGHVHFAGLSAYASAKAGVRGMTGGLARDLAPYGIRVNAVAPGHIDTEMSSVSGDPARLAERVAMIPAGRLGRPEDIAAAALFLASNRAAYITGQTLTVDGGFTLQ